MDVQVTNSITLVDEHNYGLGNVRPIIAESNPLLTSARYFSRDSAQSVGQYHGRRIKPRLEERWHDASVKSLDKDVVRAVIHF